MIPALKSCYVLLNRNFLDLGETLTGINYFPKVEMENCAESYRSKISDRKTLSSKISKENYPKLRNKVQINYSDDMKNTEGEDSDSEFSYDSSSSDDDDEEQKRKKTIPKKLSCLLCNQYFSTHLSYLKHKRSHESKPFKCILCRKGCENRPCFLNHMKKLHPEVDPFVCEYPGCEQNFKTQKRLEIHRKMHWRYMCKYCKKFFARKHHMKKHVLKIH